MKKILGLDLGTNSIGWALIDENANKIDGVGSRIIPMTQEILGEFEKGNSISQTAARTGFRGTRRTRERNLLRRERLHRVLNLLGFLPKHYSDKIDFEKHFGQFLDNSEPKLVYDENKNFIFKSSFNKMLEDFKIHQPQLLINKKGENALIPYDWTIYYLRKEALKRKIEKEELAWILLNFNQKRGSFQLRDEDNKQDNENIEIVSTKIVEVKKGDKDKKYNKYWYEVKLENGLIYNASFYSDISHWIGQVREFIIKSSTLKDGTLKNDISFLPTFEEIEKMDKKQQDKLYSKIKIKTEKEIDGYGKTVGCYIYDTLLQKPNQKIRGKLIRTIERKFYKEELIAILEKQKGFHSELQSTTLYNSCLEKLYQYNDSHRNSINTKDFTHLFVNDIIFYQRPLKSKKSLVSNCRYESRTYINKETGQKETVPIKCIAKSHPLFQEFRLWQWLKNLRLFNREDDNEITSEFLKTENDWVDLFDWLNDRKEIKQEVLFTSYFKVKTKKGETLKYRWNYVEDKVYPCNETRSQILARLAKTKNFIPNFLTKEIEESLWHILYSVEDKDEISKALTKFAVKHNLDNEFIEHFKKFPRIEKEYGSYSAKAIKKLLPLMRMGRYWNESNIDTKTKIRIEKIINGEVDEKIKERVREKSINFSSINDFKALPLWLACYVVYNKHSEDGNIKKWTTADNIQLLEQHSLCNPIVEQVINETLQVVKEIWNHYGGGKENFFKEIHIELGREMKNPADKRNRITEQVTENENTNLRIKALLAELANHSDIENVRPYSPSQQELLKIYEDGVVNLINQKSASEEEKEIIKISKLAQPSKSELIKYKCWLEQKYRSPYTGEIIPLSKLFTSDYEIEHVIPQSRYFDDSFSNKVICESEVNKLKSNQLGFEFIKNHHGEKVDLNFGKTVTIFTIEAYEEFVKTHYVNNKSKLRKLLMDEIPETFIQRQLNDSRYISKVVKNLMSNIVRENDEQETTSKNVLSSNGSITSVLKQDWGLNDVWNDIISPRFIRLNELTKSNNFGNINSNTKKFLPQVPIELQKGFNKKRIDHRHHALDALVIACATRNHINYLNNEHARAKDDNIRFDLRNKLRRLEDVEITDKKTGEIKKIKVAKEFHKPWNTFTQDAKELIETTVVSFKQNLRVINKTINYYQKWVEQRWFEKERICKTSERRQLGY